MRVLSLHHFPLLCALATIVACGGSDSTVGPGPAPRQAASLFPETGTRTLKLVSVNDVTLPAVYYQSPDRSYDAWVDSATVTFQADSLVVVRSYVATVYPSGAVRSGSQSTLKVQAGRTAVLGDQLLTYTNGTTADTATLRPDGALEIRFWTHYPSSPPLSMGDWVFSSSYNGPVMNPVPTVTSLSPATMPMYSPKFTITINGSGFTPQTAVNWAMAVGLPITYVSPRQITVDVPTSFLGAPQTDWVFVTNPEPGGGETHATFTTVNPVPQLTSLSPTQALTGSAPSAVILTGDNFTSLSAGRVNGVARPTAFISKTQLSVTLAASDLASAGTVQVDVLNPAPGGGATTSLPFTVSGVPPRLLSQVQSSVLSPVALAADPVRPFLYVAIPVTSASMPNTVVALNASDATVAWSIPIAGSPSTLAVSDDGQFLYVGTQKDSVITRIALATHSVDLTIGLGSTTIGGDMYYSAYRAGALAVVPGHPHTIAAGREMIGASPSNIGITIWDDSTPRPQSSAGDIYAGYIVFGGSPAVLYGAEWGSSSDAFLTMSVDAAGAHDVTMKDPMFSSGDVRLAYVAGRVYASNGDVIDPASQQVIGHLAGFGSSNAIVAATDGTALYTLDASGRVIAADAAHYTALGSVTVANAGGGGTALVRWGADGIAFIAAGRVFIVRADFVH